MLLVLFCLVASRLAKAYEKDSTVVERDATYIDYIPDLIYQPNIAFHVVGLKVKVFEVLPRLVSAVFLLTALLFSSCQWAAIVGGSIYAASQVILFILVAILSSTKKPSLRPFWYNDITYKLNINDFDESVFGIHHLLLSLPVTLLFSVYPILASVPATRWLVCPFVESEDKEEAKDIPTEFV